MKFTRYIQPETAQEALQLAQKPDTVILGGMMWMRMQKRTVAQAIDLSKLGLDKIEQTPEGIRIGAYVTLRQIETDPLLLQYTHGAVRDATAFIVGVQFRNTATVGGSIFGRFGFSDISTLFTALGASVILAGKGTVPMDDFMREGASHDVLTHILLPLEAPDAAVSMAHRNTATDFPIITTAVCRRKERVRVTLSPAPVRGQTADYAVSEIDQIAERFVQSVTFRSGTTASAAYREHLARVLLRRCLETIGG